MRALRGGLVTAGILLAWAIAFSGIGLSRRRAATNVVLRVNVATSSLGLVARSYDGEFPGPTIHANPGEILSIEIVNELDPSFEGSNSVNTLRFPNVTSLHVHGLHVSPEEDDVFSPVSTRKVYTYHIPRNHPSGTFWYHAHYHGSSSLQVGGGMAGALIIGAPCGTVVVVQQTNVAQGKARNYKYASLVSGSLLPIGDVKQNRSVFTVNGRLRPLLVYSERLRLINAASNDGLRLSFDCAAAKVVARDGIEHEPRTIEGEVAIAPGSRADIVLEGTCAQILNAGELLFTVRPSRRPKQQKCPEKRERESLTRATPFESFRFELDQGSSVTRDGVNYTWYGINGKAYEANATGPVLFLGKVYEWTLVNPNKAQHPFHLHTNHFQITHVASSSTDDHQDYRVGDWRDTITLPTPGNVTIRFRPTDFVGTSLAHCHIFAHADLGMDLRYTIVAGNRSSLRPPQR